MRSMFRTFFIGNEYNDTEEFPVIKTPFLCIQDSHANSCLLLQVYVTHFLECFISYLLSLEMEIGR